MTVVEEEAAAPADALAKELTDVRRRGLDDMDLQTSQQPRLALPLLEVLARRYTSDHDRGRIELIKRLLQDALSAYATARNLKDAQLVRRLFFDDKTGEAPGPKRPIGLRQAALRASGLSEPSFDKRRATAFREFAAFLLSFGDVGQAPPQQEASKPQDRRRLILLLAVVLALAVVSTVVWRARSDGGDHSTDNVASSTASGTPAATTPSISPSSADETGTLTFDDLGGGSTIIGVYAGARDLPQDRQRTGTFNSGDTVRAICQVTGRTVTSDTSVGERPQQSNVWVRIDGSPGVQQYASLTYADISADALSALPTCADAP